MSVSGVSGPFGRTIPQGVYVAPAESQLAPTLFGSSYVVQSSIIQRQGYVLCEVTFTAASQYLVLPVGHFSLYMATAPTAGALLVSVGNVVGSPWSITKSQVIATLGAAGAQFSFISDGQDLGLYADSAATSGGSVYLTYKI